MKESPPSPDFPIGRWLGLLVNGVPSVQAGLDRQWLEEMSELAAIVPAAPGAEALLRAVAPSRINFCEATLEARVMVRQSRETEFSLSVRPLNMSFVRRYGSQSYSTCTLTISVRQAPAPPRDVSTFRGG